ncbi:hypothetical protein ACQP2C_12155 [Micromonospora zamorensis]|uniref:hypothetical protein n=1 Tax=Micromonospora zamorensis TaxID=709883 RepID=UPI003D9514F7
MTSNRGARLRRRSEPRRSIGKALKTSAVIMAHHRVEKVVSHGTYCQPEPQPARERADDERGVEVAAVVGHDHRGSAEVPDVFQPLYVGVTWLRVNGSSRPKWIASRTTWQPSVRAQPLGNAAEVRPLVRHRRPRRRCLSERTASAAQLLDVAEEIGQQPAHRTSAMAIGGVCW